jgi:hypothetical protein
MKAAAICAVGIFALGVVLRSSGVTTMTTPASGTERQPQAIATFKYAYVVETDGAALICFAEANGCRIERVTVPPVEVKISSSRAIDASATARLAVVEAVAMLGDVGWDMVGVGSAYGHYQERPAVHFRKLGR